MPTITGLEAVLLELVDDQLGHEHVDLLDAYRRVAIDVLGEFGRLLITNRFARRVQHQTGDRRVTEECVVVAD